MINPENPESPESPELLLKLLNEHGYPVTISLVCIFAVKYIFGHWLAEIKTNTKLMQDQINRLAEDNRAYRILFLEKMGLTDADLEKIVPAYKTKK